MKSAVQAHHFFHSWDGTELYYQSCIPEKKHGVLIVIHGLGEHSGRYQFLVDYFSQRGWALYLMDQRGHGHSPGQRCHADRFSDLVDDLESFVRHTQTLETKLPLFLVAHSFGGQVAVNYLARQPHGLKGAVLSGPNLRVAMRIALWKRLIGYAGARLAPTFTLKNDIHPEWVSHDEAVVRAYETDKLVCGVISLKLGTDILDNLDGIMELAPKIKLPCLIVHGEDDKIISVEGSQEFYDRMTIKDRTLKIYPGLYHETFNEIGKEKVFTDIEQWLEARLNK